MRVAERSQWREKAIVPAAIALALSSALVFKASDAAFSGFTSNQGNAWAAGNVTLTNDALLGQAVFNESGLKPGSTGTKCITVTYTGSLGANVRLYVTNPSTADLGQYLDLTVAEGTGATNAACAGFTADGTSTPFVGTLQSFGATHNSFSNGTTAWAATKNATRSYKITWTLQDQNEAQGLSAAATFKWEAQST